MNIPPEELVVISKMLKMQIEENEKYIDSETRWTPFHLAADLGLIDIISIGIAKKIDLNVKNDEGNTPLHLAALKGRHEIVKLLLSNSTDSLNVQNEMGSTPLHLASFTKNRMVIGILLFYDASTDIKDNFGLTPVECGILRDFLGGKQVERTNPSVSVI